MQVLEGVKVLLVIGSASVFMSMGFSLVRVLPYMVCLCLCHLFRLLRHCVGDVGCQCSLHM